MRKTLWRLLWGWVLLWLFLGYGVLPVCGQTPVVHAILFYSPSCGHCHYVMTEVLPPLAGQYGEQFVVVEVDTTTPEGQKLYRAAIETFDIPEERRGVPTLVLGEAVMVGSGEIPERLPGLIESHLAAGGVDWPAIPGIEATVPVEVPAPVAEAPADWQMRFTQDLAGNVLSIVVLVGMIMVVVYRLLAAGDRVTGAPVSTRMAVPVLVVLGLIVAGYLAYVETQQVTAVCGPVGDCNSVQQSEYARLFGVLPIAVLGVMGYVAIGAAWMVARYARGDWKRLASWALVGMAWFGILFSIYLTFLEPFVIGATCAWCLTSAVVMTALFWVINHR